MHAMGDDDGMSIDDESHRKPSPPRSERVGGDPVAPRALSIDEEWAVIMALEEERGRTHAPEQTAVAAVSVVVVRLYGDAVDRGDPKSLIMPFLLLGTLWWNCVIHALYVTCVRRMNPSAGFHVGAAIAAFVVSSVAAFVCVWMFVTAVNLGVVAGA